MSRRETKRLNEVQGLGREGVRSRQGPGLGRAPGTWSGNVAEDTEGPRWWHQEPEAPLSLMGQQEAEVPSGIQETRVLVLCAT